MKEYLRGLIEFSACIRMQKAASVFALSRSSKAEISNLQVEILIKKDISGLRFL